MYSDDETTLITIAMLKKYGVRHIVTSPGTRNADFVASCQEDPFFKMYSVVDERSAAYFATGLAFEASEPVVITCTGATAARNYLPALTEAYYRHIPIIMLTVGAYAGSGAFLTPQHIDNSVLPNDTNYGQFQIMGSSAEQEFILNRALCKVIYKPIGPVHIHIHTLANAFNVKNLPEVNKVDYYSGESLPTEKLQKSLAGKKIGIFIGSHSRMSRSETAAIEKFAIGYGAVVFADHTSNYTGRNRILIGQACDVKHISNLPEIMIDIGGINGIYANKDLFQGAQLWRISPDGEMKQRHGVLRKFFDCREETFFNVLAGHSKSGYFEAVKNEIGDINSEGLPLSNTLVCAELSRKIPDNSTLHLGIQNTCRNMNMFDLDNSITSVANVGGFGIDAPVSTLVGQSMANKDKLYFALVGDLAFFYDMNILGNRHINNNIRILLVNNNLGVEFRLSPWFSEKMSADKINEYIAAKGHFGSARAWAESMGFEYCSAKSMKEFDEQIDLFCKKGNKPIFFEVFTNAEDEINAIKILRKNNDGLNPYPHAMYQGDGSMGWSPNQSKPDTERKLPLSSKKKQKLKNRIAIVGCANLINYGSGLTYYALAKTIMKMGYQFQIILPPLDSNWGAEPGWPCWKEVPFASAEIAARFKTKEDMSALNNDFNTFMLGSDQFLRPDIAEQINKYCLLDWVDNSKRKITYAASFGYDKLECSEDNKMEMQKYLGGFDSFSVRERSGVNVAAEELNISAEWVLDPVFMCGRRHFDALAEKSDLQHQGITAYILDKTEEKQKIIESEMTARQLPCYEISDVWKNKTQIYTEDFVRAFKDSEMIITDSFHGVCFALIYKKPFIAICNAWRGATRFNSLLGLVKLENRLVYSLDDYMKIKDNLPDIDWGAVGRRIRRKRRVSRDFLARAMTPPGMFRAIRLSLRMIETRLFYNSRDNL